MENQHTKYDALQVSALMSLCLSLRFLITPLVLLALAAQFGCGRQEASPTVTSPPVTVDSGLQLCLGPRGEPQLTMQAYPYYYVESTYSEQLIRIDGVDHEIHIDPETSDPETLNALYALKWNVLYPNSDGQITLIGTYHPDQGKFSLQHWTLETPFIEYFGENPLEYPILPIQRDELVSEDFRRPIRHDPRIYHQYFSEERLGGECDHKRKRRSFFTRPSRRLL